jgi:hypothetical protein
VASAAGFAGARLRVGAGLAAGFVGFRVFSTELMSATALIFMSRVVIP